MSAFSYTRHIQDGTVHHSWSVTLPEVGSTVTVRQKTMAPLLWAYYANQSPILGGVKIIGDKSITFAPDAKREDLVCIKTSFNTQLSDNQNLNQFCYRELSGDQYPGDLDNFSHIKIISWIIPKHVPSDHTIFLNPLWSASFGDLFMSSINVELKPNTAPHLPGRPVWKLEVSPPRGRMPKW